MIHKYFNINDAGHSVRCKLYCNDARNIKKIVFFGHGFGGHKDNKAAEKFAEKTLSKYKNVAVLVFNWPSHGDDGKNQIRLADCDDYITLAIEYAKKQFSVSEIYVNATSFGGYLFLKYIYEHGNPFTKLVFRCPAIPMYDVMMQSIVSHDQLKQLEKGRPAMIGFDRKIKVYQDFLQEIKENDISKYEYIDYAEEVLILHGTKDEVVPIEKVEQFADENIIEFIPIENADHRFQEPKKMELANKYILEFFDL